MNDNNYNYNNKYNNNNNAVQRQINMFYEDATERDDTVESSRFEYYT